MMQAAAIIVGLAALGFFVFASAYYARNRRMALAERDRERTAHPVAAGPGGAEAVDPADPEGETGSGVSL